MNKNKKYVRGRTFEYKIATLLKRKGYFVTRSAGSHGVADLVAIIKGKRPLLVQCKTGATKISNAECNLLYLTAHDAESIAIVASKEDRMPIVFTVLTGLSFESDGGKRIIKGSEL